MLNGSPRRLFPTTGSELVTAAHTAPAAGLDDYKDNDENSEGNEPSADPQRLARECHVVTPFRLAIRRSRGIGCESCLRGQEPFPWAEW
jgi:hypothetical protein